MQPSETFLRLACLSYTDEDGDAQARGAAARRVLADNPGLARSDVHVAAALSDVDALRSLLAADPGAARREGGPHGWPPLLYLCYARHDPDVPEAAVVEAARALLAAGADPDAGFLWQGLVPPFTALTGAFGGGERDQPAHPHAIALARVLLDAGADANDGQALYNRMFRPDDSHLALLFAYGLGAGDGGPWRRKLGAEQQSPAEMLRYQLRWAVTHGLTRRVRLLAEHGADVRTAFDDGTTPAELALTTGHPGMVAALGVPMPTLAPRQAFVAAAMAADHAACAQADAGVVAGLRTERPGLGVWAAAHGRPGAVGLLVEHGWAIDALGRTDVPRDEPWQTALHAAAEKGDVALARDLLARGADPAVRDARFGGTPLDWARFFHQAEVAELLTPYEPPGS